MTTVSSRRRFWTIPNMLSLLRLALIPVFIIQYRNGNNVLCAVILIASGFTDLLDGWIARRFGLVSDVGKVLDPIADKMTLAAALGMLLAAYPILLLPFVILLFKETVMFVSGLAAVVRTSEVSSARWHGKMTTAVMYLTMFLHVLWQDIPPVASNTMAAVCTCLMLLSMSLYLIDNIRRIRCGRGGLSDAVQDSRPS